MAETRKVIKVFIASPSDLGDERRAAREIVDEINNQLGAYLCYQVELVGWEDTLPGMGRPQALINKDLERCDFFIGMLWKHWGTPPGGKYTSGFEEEFETSVLRYKATKRPEIKMLFKAVPEELMRDPGDHLKKVIAFKDKLIQSKSVFFKDFSDSKDFYSQLRNIIIALVIGLAENEKRVLVNSEEAKSLDDLSQTVTNANNNKPHENPLSAEGARFLVDFVRATETQSFDQDDRALEIARFRLLST